MEIQETAIQTAEILKRTSTLKMDTQNAVNENKESLLLCTEEGEKLLACTANGMNEELDRQIATFIERAKLTVKKMTEKRKTVTQVFDMVKKGFTTMENLVSVKCEDSVVFKLQQKRNEYAAMLLEQKRREEEERKKRERIEAAKIQLASDTKEILNTILSEEKAKVVTSLGNTFSLLTLDNKDDVRKKIENVPLTTNFGEIFVKFAPSYPSEVPVEDARAVMNTAYAECIGEIKQSYSSTVVSTRDAILMKFDSKIKELEEFKRQTDEIKRKEEELKHAAEEERRLKEEELKKAEEERRLKEEELKKADQSDIDEMHRKIMDEAEQRNESLKVEKATAQAQALFNQTTATMASQVKMKVSKHLEVLDRDGWLEIIQQWWTVEGSMMSEDKLSSKLDFMRKACEKQANKEEVFIKSEHIAYIDDVKAK